MKVPIDNPDTTNEDFNYWEKVLESHGLSMDSGYPKRLERPDRRRRLVFVGSTHDLENIEEKVLEEEKILGKSSGRVVPKGHGPE